MRPTLRCSPPRRNSLLLLILLTLLASVLAACKPASPPGPPDASRPTITAAATALDKKDGAAFVETLSAPLRAAVAGQLDLSGPGAAQMAKALRAAKLVAEYDMVRVYETTIDGETFSFMAVKEGDKWLLSGL